MQNEKLNPAEYDRYHRQLQMPNFGEAEQLLLKAAKVLVIGAGGLGVPLLQYLAGAGVGTIGIVDYDRVELSNLHRQVFYHESEVGELKAVVAKRRVEELNSLLKCVVHPTYLNAQLALELISQYDIIVDATDNFPTRYLVNDACYLLGKPLVYGAIYRFEGQVAVFNFPLLEGRSTNYRDLFPQPPAAGLVPNCNEAGVLGVLPGIIGSMQANEVLKIITGIGEPLVDRLFTIDVLNYDNYRLKIKKHPDNPLSQEMSLDQEVTMVEQLCSLHPEPVISEINFKDLQRWQTENIDFQLIDVRELKEHLAHNIGGDCIPLSQLHIRLAEVKRDKPVVIYCHVGKRSMTAIELLTEVGYTELFNLRGGIVRAHP